MKRPKGERPTRSLGREEVRRIVRVHSEGTVTELGYLRHIARGNTKVTLTFGPGGMVPLSLVDRARADIRERRRRNAVLEFDEIWVVFDIDKHPNVKQARVEAQQNSIQTAISNPCFELWLLLHVEEHNRPIDRRAAQSRARNLGLIDKKSIALSAWPSLDQSYKIARTRAIKLDQRHEGDGSPRFSNPSSSVWRLVDSLSRE